jgi:hypothetical protein
MTLRWRMQRELRLANMLKAIASILCFGILVSGCRAPQDNLIVPGKRVGILVVGRTKANEVGVNGSVSDKYNDRGLGISFDQNLRIDAVHVTRSNYKTKEGLTVGDTEDKIVAVYGKGEIVNIPIMAGNVQKATYSNHALRYPGIHWVIGEDDNVTSIFVSQE